MLDQNADRSWWMIGAVIVGAALVGIASLAFPELFNTVIDFFTNQIPTQLGIAVPNLLGLIKLW